MIRLTQNDLEVRTFEPVDAASLFELTNKNRNYLREWLPWLDYISSVKDSEKFIHDSLVKQEARTGMDLGVWYGKKLVGAIGFHDIQESNKKATLGYWLDSGHQGKGIMSTSVKLMLSYGFSELSLNRIEIKCAPGNTKSSAIPHRLGFKKEGILREVEWLYDHFVDHEVYSLLTHEWK